MSNMELKDAIDMMCSNDYKQRFKAEFLQTLIRIEKLEKTIEDYHKLRLEYEADCPINLLERQLTAMKDYILILVKRAIIEGIELE